MADCDTMFNMTKMIINKEKIRELLTRGVEEIHIRESLEKKLFSGKLLRVKHGIDPTGEKIHLGRAATLWKLREFQGLGHKIVLIIGDYTAQIGDPSDKLSKRPFLSAEQVKKNMARYKEQIGKIIDISKVEWRYNSEWLAKLTPHEIDKLAELFSVQQMLARRNFKERWNKGEDISIREFHYSLYQGYDSVVVKADVEVGGSDQLFNLLAGRDIQKAFGQAPQDILTGQMLPGLDGRKMSTSWGNVINITDAPADMYGKVMSMDDKLISEYALLCARFPQKKVGSIKSALKASKNPRDIKMEIARAIVALYCGAEAGRKAEEMFVRMFQKHEKPQEVQECKIKNAKPCTELCSGTGVKCKIIDLLIECKLAVSKSEARRVVEQGGVKVDGEIINDPSAEIKLSKKGALVQKGKRYFVRVYGG